MGDEDVIESCGGNAFDAVVDSAVEAEAGSPDDLRPALTGPRRDSVVVARDVGGNLGHDIDDPRRHPARQGGAIGIGEHAREAAFRRRESFDRNQHGETHGGPL